MANLSQEKRDRMISFLEKIKEQHSDDDSLIAINQIEKELVSKKFGLVWEKHSESVFTMMQDLIPVFTEDKDREILTDESLPYNFLLEGDNLHSLTLLAKTHRHKIDVIYIDPPYNTGAKDWKYNNDYVDKVDTYRHSKWLSMMSERMKIASTLLKDDGVFICAIDENELGPLILLIEEVFGDAYATDPIAIVHNPRGVQGDNFSYTNEYALFVYRKGTNPIGNRIIDEDEIDWRDLRDNGGESLRTDAATCFYSIIVKDGKIVGFGENRTKDIDFHPQRNVINEDGSVSIYPIDKNGIERKWRYNRESVEKVRHLLRVKNIKGILDIELGKNFGSYRTVWTDKKYDSNEYGTQLINSMVPNNEFTFPKSVYNVYDCIYAVLADRKDAIVLDYFAGSGTTGHAVLMINNNTDSQHRFILCTNNDVGEKREKEFEAKYGKIEDSSTEWHEWKNKYGIASSVTYPRIRSAIKGFIHTKDFKTVLFQKKITPANLMSMDKILKEIKQITDRYKTEYDEVKLDVDGENIVVLGIVKKGNKIKGLSANLKYYYTEFVDKESETLTDDLLEHVSEMIQIQYGVKVDGKKYVLILDDDEMDDFEKHHSDLDEIEAVFVSQDVLMTTEQESLLNKLNAFFIPDCYFDFELREAGEIW